MIEHNNEEAIEYHHRERTLGKALMASYPRKTKTGELHQCEVKGPADEYIVDKTISDIDEAWHAVVRLV